MSIKDRYVFVESTSQDQTCIGIKDGEFAGVVYKYGKVSVGEELEDGSMPFQFEFDIIDNNAIPREKFGEEWTKLIGDILVDIMDDKYAESDNTKNNIK
jgi:hypothetical protein|tara:strand:- start:1509 stop:1805 length:297 start_codon:yes stop_codon:yes gene_type:complete